MPRPPASHPYLDHDGILAFAHRGGTSDGPENTMTAFAAAIAMGYRYVETDVHLSRDGVLLAFHDSILDRVTDRQGVIAELDYADIRKARVAGREPIPLFTELLNAWPDLRINIDPKHDAAVAPLLQILEDSKAFERVCIGSFSGDRLRRIRQQVGPKLCTSMGPMEVFRHRLFSYGLPAPVPDFQCAQVPPRQYGLPVVDRRFVDAAHRRGLQVHVWTIDQPAEMERLLDLGVDGLMTDDLAALKQVLEARGLWV